MQNILVCMKVCYILAPSNKPKDMTKNKSKIVLASEIQRGDILAATGAQVHLVQHYNSVTRIHAHQGTMEAKNCEEHVFPYAKGVAIIR